MENYTFGQLKQIAKERNIRAYEDKSKSELYEFLCKKKCIPRNYPVSVDYKPETHYLTIIDRDPAKCVKRWESLKELGSGCCATVSQACALGTNDCKYVLKVSSVNDDIYFDIFQRDVHFLNLLQGTGLVPKIYDQWICGAYGYMVLELFDGNADDFMAKQSDGTELISINILEQMMELCSNLSLRGIIHGDIKPDNFLYKIKGQDKYDIVLTDFGFSADFKTFDYTRGITRVGFPTTLRCKTPDRFIPRFNEFNLLLSLIEYNTYVLFPDTKQVKLIGRDWMPEDDMSLQDYESFFRALKCQRQSNEMKKIATSLNVKGKSILDTDNPRDETY